MIGTGGRQQKGRAKTKRNSEGNAPKSPIIRINNDPTITAKANLAMAKLTGQTHLNSPVFELRLSLTPRLQPGVAALTPEFQPFQRLFRAQRQAVKTAEVSSPHNTPG